MLTILLNYKNLIMFVLIVKISLFKGCFKSAIKDQFISQIGLPIC